MDALDRIIINQLQGGFPISERPYAEIAAGLGISEQELMTRLEELISTGILSRFGPMYNLESMGGSYSLIAMRLPDSEIDRIAGIVNSYPEVAHNYEREHQFNMWFVLAVETARRKTEILDEIETATGFTTYDMPKIEEYYLGLKLDA